jgi:hypothetical protein
MEWRGRRILLCSILYPMSDGLLFLAIRGEQLNFRGNWRILGLASLFRR